MSKTGARLRLAGKAGTVAALALGAFAVSASAAQAAGTSGSTYGCYAKWWNTAFAGYCTPATKSGKFQLFANCNNESDYYSNWKYLASGSTLSPFASNECTFSVTDSYFKYTNGSNSGVG